MIPVERVTTALIAMLATAVGVPVGDHGTRTTAGASIDTTGRYLVVWKIDGGEARGALGDPHQDITVVYQVESVGRSRQQAEGLADLARTAMLAMSAIGGHTNPLAGPGWKGGLRTQQTEGVPTPQGIDEQGTGVWVQRERFDVEVHRA